MELDEQFPLRSFSEIIRNHVLSGTLFEFQLTLIYVVGDKKYLMLMCLFILELDLLAYFKSRIALFLSWYTMV